MSRPLLAPDDGLHNPFPWKHGTNKHFPCGHQRIAENINTYGTCRTCRVRLDARMKQARRDRAAEAQA